PSPPTPGPRSAHRAMALRARNRTASRSQRPLQPQPLKRIGRRDLPPPQNRLRRAVMPPRAQPPEIVERHAANLPHHLARGLDCPLKLTLRPRPLLQARLIRLRRQRHVRQPHPPRPPPPPPPPPPRPPAPPPRHPDPPGPPPPPPRRPPAAPPRR